METPLSISESKLPISKKLNSLLHEKPLLELLELAEANNIDGLVDYLTDICDKIGSLNELHSLGYREQLEYIYAHDIRKTWSRLSLVYKFNLSGYLEIFRGILIFLGRRFLEVGFDRFPILKLHGDFIENEKLKLVRTCISYALDVLMTILRQFSEGTNDLKSITEIPEFLSHRSDIHIRCDLEMFLHQQGFLDQVS